MMKALYTAEARVTGGRTHGHGRTDGGELDVDIRMPAALGGDGGGTNPEQLFAVGYAACFEASISLVAHRRNVDTDDALIDARVSLLPSGTDQLKLGVELDITLPSVDDPEQAASLVRDAHLVCPYSGATRGNIDVAFVVNGVPLVE